ncbi:MAG: hypothetical protein AAFV69_11535 [Pseudomonadota bacterium]
MSKVRLTALLFGVLSMQSACSEAPSNTNQATDALESPASASVLEFGSENTLFVADSVSGKIFAYDMSDAGPAPSDEKAYNLLSIEEAISRTVSADQGSLTYNDLAVHPVTREAYLSLGYALDGVDQAAIVTISHDGSVERLDIAERSASVFTLEDTADEAVTFWRDIPAPTLTITDLDYADGELFVSGISTGEFASTLRRVPFPFDASSTSTSIEIFHTAHAQMETRAPIRAMTVLDLDGVQTVIAAYTCTPLVTIDASALQDETNITGKTIAELGYGNTPLDVIDFEARDREGNAQSFVLVVNREMDADLIAIDDLTEAAAADGLSAPVPYLGATAGVKTTPLPLSGVLHAADQNNQFILAMRRNLETGAMELVSFRKGSFFRLSGFISEYNFPDYKYQDDQFAQGVRMFQNLLKTDEGFPDQVR